MKSPVIQQIVIYLMVPLLFLSCAKDEQVIESEIVFHVPVYKDDGTSGSSEVFVYPNPFRSHVDIACYFLEGEYAEVQLSDENGEFSMKKTISRGVYNFETADFPEGAYYLEIKKDGYVDRAKLLKINWD